MTSDATALRRPGVRAEVVFLGDTDGGNPPYGTAVRDEELVARLHTDPEAFAEFYRRHVRGLTRYATRRLTEPADAADVVADTFLAVIQSADGYRSDRGRPVAWLYGIAAHVLASHLRKQGAEQRALQRLQGRRLLAPDDHARLLDQIDAARQRGSLGAAMGQLSPTERELLALVAEEGLTPTEAAGVLDIRPATARMRLSRARRRVAAMLQDAVQQLPRQRRATTSKIGEEESKP